jgi:integrase
MLSAKKIEKTKLPGRYLDKNGVPGLYLQVAPGGSKSWILRYEINGKEKMVGLGSVRIFSLREARERARVARQLLADGIDPLEVKRSERAKQAAELAKTLTFAEAADRFFSQHEMKWSNKKHAEQFTASMTKYVYPIIGTASVAAIDTPSVLRVLEQEVPAGRGYPAGTLWSVRAETASRVRNRVESVLDWATVRGHRQGDNPARWRGHLDQVLPNRRQLGRTEHHPSMRYVDVPSFVTELREREGVAAKALLFLILTATRSGEVIGARWPEIDFETATWTIPAERMKARREYKVPVSEQAIKLLRSLLIEDDNDHLFIGGKAGAGLYTAALDNVLKRMGYKDASVHGFRSSFRTWCAEQTNYPREIAEASLAHAIGSQIERAYQRSSLFDHRRRLMGEWATFVMMPPVAGAVVPMRGTVR